MKLRRWFLIAILDSVLRVVIFSGALFSFKGLFKSVFLIALFLALGCGIGVKSKETLFFKHLQEPYISLEPAKNFRLTKDIFIQFPLVSAKAVLVVDLNSNEILFEQNSDEKLAPASTTKLMTALVAQELYFPTDLLEVPLKCAQTLGMRLGLFTQEKVKYVDLLHALLIASSNDAACVLANAKLSEDEFVLKMNNKTQKLGLENTHFTNPMGFDNPEFAHFSTATDLYKLGLEVRLDPQLKAIISKKEYVLTSGLLLRKIYATNHLMWTIPETVGIKTGTTSQAGQVFIYEYEDLAKNRNLLIVLMGSEDRFGETKQILGWAFEKYSWR